MFLNFLFSLFKSKKPSLKLSSKQEVEIEFCSEDDRFETHFAKVLDIQRKKVIIKSPGTERRPIRMLAGQALTVTTLDGSVLYSFQTTVLDAGDREFDIAPPENVSEEQLPPFNESCQIEVQIPVEYRAMNSAHNQVAQTHSITYNGLILATNLPIPVGTNLHLEVEMPGAPDFSAKGRAVASEPNRSTNPKAKKHLCEIEYVDIDQASATSILRYAAYAKRRQQRKIEREGPEAAR